MPPQVIPTDEALESVTCDALVVGAFIGDEGPVLTPETEKLDSLLDGFVSEYLREIDYKPRVGAVAIVSTARRVPATAIVVAGLGPLDRAGPTEVRRAAGAAARALAARRVVASALHHGVAEAAGAAVEGFLLGSYRFTSYRSDPKPSKIQRIMLVDGADHANIARAQARAEATTLARDLVNEPSATATPEFLARKAQEIADVHDLECTVLDESELAARGFGGILGVAQGSDAPPRLVVLRHKPSAPRGKVALVGKGVTFDSGGLSIKDAKGMETMKTDMAGAAAVIGAMSAVARLEIPLEIVAFVPATENMPGGRAIKPGDVIKHYGGRTSEVLNTDAEGRLILADALAWACEEKPDAIVDVATLTGAIMVALGKKAAGLFSTHDKLARELLDAARDAGERVWHMPLYDEYRPDIDSDIADVRNTGPRWGGSINAALFLRDFVDRTIPWAHLDIAGAARADADYEELPKGGTGFAVRTLLSFLEGRGR